MAQQTQALGHVARLFTIDFGLAATKGIALQAGTCGGFDAADAAPALAQLGGEKAHLIFGVMHPATVTKEHFRHGNLVAEGIVADSMIGQYCREMTAKHDAFRNNAVICLKQAIPKLAIR